MESFRDLYYALLDSYEFHYNKVIEDAAVGEIKFILPCIGVISVDAPLSKLLFLPVFRRLKDVKQLAHTHVYLPGATHTRYEHSLGVMAISLKLLEKLRRPLGEKGIDVDSCDSMILGIAALLHDIGHASWGHALDGLTGIISEYFTEFLERKLFLSDVGKLDIAIALYLLEHNEQLARFFNDMANEIAKRCGKKLEPEHLRKIVWLVISEEWNMEHLGSFSYDWVRKIKLFQTILGSPEGIGGVNADRLDWIVRDSHHTYVEMYVQISDEIFRKVQDVVKKIMKDGDISDLVLIDLHDDIPRAGLKGSETKEAIRRLREKLYAHVYEGFERTLTDSLLTRLVFSALKILYHVGKKYTGPSIILRVITSYLLQPDHDLLTFTRKILDAANNTNLADYNIVEPKEQLFIRNSSRLVKYIDNIDMVVHSLRNQRPNKWYLTWADLKLDWLSTSIPSFDVGIVSISCENYGKLIVRALKSTLKTEIEDTNVSNKYLLLIYNNLLLGPRINLFKVLEVADIETTIHQEISRKYGDIDGVAGFYVLPNYYAFRKLWDTYWRERDRLTSVNDLISLMKGPALKDYPLLIILTELRRDYSRSRMSRLEDLMEKSAAIALEKLVMHIQKYFAIPSLPRKS